jgi:nitrite reductase/ring-hydroxylating ferredoxin subunit/uncharacterized membrane protein
MPRLSELLERTISKLENAAGLDPAADAVQQISGKLPPGPVKDTLSGTQIGHPLHPLLVTLPIGAFTWACVLDLTRGDERAARRLIGLGLLAVLPTALTGISDWSDTEGAERRVGLVHAATNTVSVGLLIGSWVARRSPGRGRLTALAGLGLIGVSGWLGGHLAYAMGVGVDTTAFSAPPEEWTDAVAEADLSDGLPHAVTVDGLPVLLVRTGATVYALANRCTHRGAPLDEGKVVDGCIECPWHASRFRLSDGAVERGPATRPQPALAVRLVAGRVQVRRDEPKALRTNPV